MHLADGTLSLAQAGAYAAASGAVVALGVRNYYKNSQNRLDYKIISGVFTAFVFTATVFEIPMPFGSTEHPTGTPLMAIFMGPLATAFLSTVVLIMELVLREGGLTTLGANVFSLGIVGGMIGWSTFKLSRRFGLGIFAAGLLAGTSGDLCVYLMTAAQLAFGGSDGNTFWYYFIAFIPGQVPLALLEGIFTGIILNFLYTRRREILIKFGVAEE